MVLFHDYYSNLNLNNYSTVISGDTTNNGIPMQQNESFSKELIQQEKAKLRSKASIFKMIKDGHGKI